MEPNETSHRRQRDNAISAAEIRASGVKVPTGDRLDRRTADADRAIEGLLTGWPIEARTPAETDIVPVWDPGEDPDLKRPEFYLNREFGWLNFNFRVLHEAEDVRVPLLERLRYISIVSSNIDRFFMTRIGGLKQQVGAGLLELTVDGRTPQEQIDKSCEFVRLLEERKRLALGRLVAELNDTGVALTTYGQLTPEDRKALREHYVENVYPLVTPQATDPAHPFPFVSNLSLNLLVSLRYPGGEREALARVKVPVDAGTPRFLKLEGRNTFVTLESVMAHNLDLLFPGMEVVSCELFRVTRNANTELDEDKAEDLLELIETGLRERKFAPIVRLEVASDMNSARRGALAADLGLHENTDVFEVDDLMAMRDLEEVVRAVEDPAFHFAPHAPVDHPLLCTERSMFHVVREAGSLLLHFPYQSFTTSIERFLREASRDTKVRAIKMTIYRTSATSKAIQYLMDAALNGKQVTVVVELKARFDEAANIRWANRLGQVGIHVTYGVVGLKTHCKAILVVRQDFDGLRRYAHIGTGNYNADTARLYADLGLLTSDESIGKDLTELFNYLTTGFKPKRDYRKLLPAPKILKTALLKKIKREMALHSEERPGLIQFKMNALEDADVTRALYVAARAGVRVDLLVRDSSRLRPGIPGLSESVRVISIVGRFLEHARVYYFANGGDEEYYIGSADCMRRNLKSRVELFVPVEDPELRAGLRYLLDTQLTDQRNAWEMQPDGSYVKRGWPGDSSEKGSQDRLIGQYEKELKAATRLRRRRAAG